MFLTTIFSWLRGNKTNSGIYTILLLVVILPVVYMLYKGVGNIYKYVFNIESSDTTIERLTNNNKELLSTYNAYKVNAVKKEVIAEANTDTVVKKIKTDNNVSNNVVSNKRIITNNAIPVKHLVKPSITNIVKPIKNKQVNAIFEIPDNNKSNYLVIDDTEVVTKEDYKEYGRENIDAIYNTYDNVKAIK